MEQQNLSDPTAGPACCDSGRNNATPIGDQQVSGLQVFENVSKCPMLQTACSGNDHETGAIARFYRVLRYQLWR